MASNVSPVRIVSGTYNASSGAVTLVTDGELASFDDYPVGAWWARFGNHERSINYVAGGGYEILLDSSVGDPSTGPNECSYLATPPTIVDVNGLTLGAQGPLVLTPA